MAQSFCASSEREMGTSSRTVRIALYRQCVLPGDRHHSHHVVLLDQTKHCSPAEGTRRKVLVGRQLGRVLWGTSRHREHIDQYNRYDGKSCKLLHEPPTRCYNS
ncbi:hypothetical protein BV20DRAFT_973672 [Pilatotrama ljubarskyi]|nr:hypothetical protein BV20DRAFT_973672 [Pilatotrama ljubarskyi]